MDNPKPDELRESPRRHGLILSAGLAITRLMRLPFDLLFLTWDFLVLTAWGVVQLGAPIWGDPWPRFGTRTGTDVIAVGSNRLRRCTVARKYGNPFLIRLLLARIFPVRSQTGRTAWAWEQGGTERPTTPTRYLSVAIGLVLFWGAVALVTLAPLARQALGRHLSTSRTPPLESPPQASAGVPPAPANDPMRATEAQVRALLDADRGLDALAVCRNAVERHPDKLRPRQLLCSTLTALGWSDEACDAANAVLAVDPGDTTAHLSLALTFHRKGLSSLAIEHCERILARNPGHRTALRLCAAALMERGDFGAAATRLEALRATLPQKPDHAAEGKDANPGMPGEHLTIPAQLAECYLRQGNPDKAIAILQETAQGYPDSPFIRSQLAQTYLQAGQHAEALSQLRALDQAAPNDTMTLNNLALAAATAGNDPDGALAYARRALDADPGNPRIMDTLAYVHLTRKEYTEALQLTTAARRLAPDQAVILYHQAEALSALGQAAKAKEALRRALALRTRFEGSDKATALLAKLEATAGADQAPGQPPPQPSP